MLRLTKIRPRPLDRPRGVVMARSLSAVWALEGLPNLHIEQFRGEFARGWVLHPNTYVPSDYWEWLLRNGFKLDQITYRLFRTRRELVEYLEAVLSVDPPEGYRPE